MRLPTVITRVAAFPVVAGFAPLCQPGHIRRIISEYCSIRYEVYVILALLLCLISKGWVGVVLGTLVDPEMEPGNAHSGGRKPKPLGRLAFYFVNVGLQRQLPGCSHHGWASPPAELGQVRKGCQGNLCVGLGSNQSGILVQTGKYTSYLSLTTLKVLRKGRRVWLGDGKIVQLGCIYQDKLERFGGQLCSRDWPRLKEKGRVRIFLENTQER